jgi:hypothetical protein
MALTRTLAGLGRDRARERGAAAGAVTPWRALLASCVALAALSLLGPSVPTYDPTAWLIWGREIVHLDLATLNGPSWKPLPVLFTTPFALLGDTLAPLLWLVVARAGGLFSFALAFRVAARLAGPAAGLIAVAALVLENVFVVDFARGNSEGLQVALTLWAIERHLDGRPRDAFALGVAVGLLRPEIWPFVAAYGAWLAFSDRRAVPLVGGGFAALLALWFVPDYLGSGELLRSAARAAEPVDGTPGQAAVPFIGVLDNATRAVIAPVWAGAVVAVLVAVRRRRQRAVVLGIAALAAGLTLAVALGAQVGFTGGWRYLVVPASLVCVLAGVGWGALGSAARRRLGVVATSAIAAIAVAACMPFITPAVDRLRVLIDNIGVEAEQTAAIRTAIAAAGGEAAVKRCGPIGTGRYQTQAVAWYLRLHQYEVDYDPLAPATTIAAPNSELARDPRFPPLARTRRWVVGSSCRP